MTVEAGAGTAARQTRLADLYARRVPSAVSLAYLITGDRSLAEDLAQEAFVRMAGRFQYLRSPDSVDGYLRRVVVNLCLSELRRRKSERSYLEREAGQPSVAATPDPAEQDALWQELLGLPERQRAALVLRYYEDLSERQAADILRCSVPAVRSLVARGVESLRLRIRGE